MTDLEYLKKYVDPNKLDEAIEKLKQNIPVQYIVGNVDFYGLILKVNNNVLIPRFETEQLVNKTYNYILKYFPNNLKIADIGTGSGCIAITLKKLLSNSYVEAVDISSKALEVARENAKDNKCDVTFYLGDLLEPLKNKVDLLISNPPYIAYDDPDVMDIVKKNEPHLALFASNNGLEFYEKIISKAKDYLNEKSMISLEIGFNQALSVKKIAYKYFPASKVLVEKDMQGKDRFVFILNNLL